MPRSVRATRWNVPSGKTSGCALDAQQPATDAIARVADPIAAPQSAGATMRHDATGPSPPRNHRHVENVEVVSRTCSPLRPARTIGAISRPTTGLTAYPDEVQQIAL